MDILNTHKILIKCIQTSITIKIQRIINELETSFRLLTICVSGHRDILIEILTKTIASVESYYQEIFHYIKLAKKIQFSFYFDLFDDFPDDVMKELETWEHLRQSVAKSYLDDICSLVTIKTLCWVYSHGLT